MKILLLLLIFSSDIISKRIKFNGDIIKSIENDVKENLDINPMLNKNVNMIKRNSIRNELILYGTYETIINKSSIILFNDIEDVLICKLYKNIYFILEVEPTRLEKTFFSASNNTLSYYIIKKDTMLTLLEKLYSNELFSAGKLIKYVYNNIEKIVYLQKKNYNLSWDVDVLFWNIFDYYNKNIN